MKRIFAKSAVALFCGILFGVGLGISRMTDPNKVISFLNLAGSWDASLLLVLASALIVTTIGFRLLARGEPVLDSRFHLPTQISADRKLVLGAAVFGIGWGLGGFCPGTAVAALSGGSAKVAIFVIAMIAGGWVTDRISTIRARRPSVQLR